MKKILVILIAMLFGTGAFAESIYVIRDRNMSNYWEKKDVDVQKVLSVSYKILNDNKINKRIPVFVDSSKTVNAFSSSSDKQIVIYKGILPYIDSDDELAYIISHEMAHSIDFYGGYVKQLAMRANSKSYEMKADLKGIDFMVGAGYNPVAAIIIGTKIFGEPYYDWGFNYTHPKGSKRVMAMYKYIYKKYPKYLNSDMTKHIAYQNFLHAMDKEIKSFHAREKSRSHVINGDL